MKTKLFLGMLFAASAMSVGTVSAKAADTLTWAGTGDSASWDTTNENWLNGDEPATWADGSDAIFGDDDVATEVTIDEAITAQTVTVTGGEYSWILSDSGSLTVTGGSSSTSVSATINGSLSLAGGETSFEKRVYIGYTADLSSATGSLEITDGTTTFGGIVRIGSRASENTSEEASGSLTISGGTVIFETNVLAGYDEAKSDDGSSTGTITITGGNVTFSNQVRLGQGMSDSGNGYGTATMTIGSSSTTGEEPTVAFSGTVYIGFGDLGTGTLNIESGKVTFNGTVNISYPGDNSTGGDGSINISGGDTTFSGTVNVGLSNSSRAGESTKASIEITGGSVTFSGTTTVTSTGTLTISGGTTILDEAGTLTVSNGGSITISGGTIDLHHAISNEGTITITEGSTVVFVLDGALLESTGSHTYTFIDGGNIVGWEDYLSANNFAYSNGAGIATSDRTTIDLTVVGQVTITTGGALDLIWTGTEDNYTWSTGGNNWKTAGGNTEEFLSDDNVTFDNTAASKNVAISEVIEAGTVTVSGAEYTFEFSGYGSLVAETLTITDGATLTITGSGEKVTIGSGEDSGRTYIGYDSTGTLKIIDGATTFKDIVSVGYSDSPSTATATGTLTISGGSTTFEDLVRIGTSYTGSQGSDSTGLLEITDGEVTFDYLVRIGAGNSSNETGSGTGTLSISGGTVTFEDRVQIGYSDLGTGTLEITGGTVIFNGNVFVSFSDPSLDGEGMGAGGTGTIKIGSVDGSGGDIDVTFNGNVYVGYTSDSDESLGTFEITDGTVKFTDDVYIGYTNTHDSTDISQGVFKISGGDVSFEGDNLYIGVSGESGASTGVGSLEISGGEVSISSTTYVGYNNAVVETETSYGSLTITGGTTTFENEVYIGYDNRAGDVDGELTIAGGEVIFKDTLYIGYGEAGDGTLTLTGGEITLYETIENEGTIIISGDVVFVLDNLQGVTDSDGHITYTFITGTGTVEGWENLTLTTSNFEIDGAILTGRTQIEIGEAGQMTIVELDDAADLVWAGTNSNNVWTETRDNKIWLNEGEADYFYSYDNVTFDDTATNKAVVVAGKVAAGSVTVSGADYTFTIGDDSSLKANSLTITDTGSLKVDGLLAASEADIAGSLDIAGGETTIDTITVDGSLKVSGGSLATDSATVSGELSVSGTGSLTITDNLTSTGKVSIADSGTLSLTAGSATIADLTSTGSGSITVSSSATLSLTGTVDISTAIANDGSVSISDTTIFALNDALIVSTTTTDEVNSTTYTFIVGDGTIENWHDLTYKSFEINGEAVTSARQIEFTTDGSIIYHDNAVAADLVWNGTDTAGKNIWTDSTDTDTNQDWLNGSRVDAFYDEDNVTFADVEGVTKTVLVDSSVIAGTVTVTGSGYTFTGLGDSYSITADSLTVESTGSLTIAVAENGSGSLTAGEAEIAGSLSITGGSVAIGTITVSGSLTVSGGSLTIGSSSKLEEGDHASGMVEESVSATVSGTFEITAGATIISGTLAIEGGSLIVSDGSLRADSLTITGEEGSATLTGGTTTVGIVTVGENSSLTVGASLTATSADISGTATVSGTMSVSDSLNVAGSLKLDGESASLTATSATVSGSLELTAGKTTIGDLTSTGSGSISVSSDATLSLTSTVDISTAIANEGTITLGESVVFVMNDSLMVEDYEGDGVLYTLITAGGTIENWHDLTYSNFTINGEAVTSARQIEFTETDGTIIYHDNAVAATLVWAGTEDNNVWTDSTDVDLNRDWLNGERADSFYDGDNVIFAEVDDVTKTVVVDGVVPAGTITVTGSGYTFTFDEEASLAANTLIVDGGELTITEGTTKIGSDTDTGSVFIGYDEENRSTNTGGSLTIYGGTFTVAKNLLVGSEGSLTIGKTENGTTPVVTIGGDLAIMGATGTISSGSVEVAGVIEVTYGSSLAISDGTVSVAGYVLIGGEDDTTSSSLTITNGSLTVSGHMEAAYGSSLEISGGTVSVSDYVLVYGDEDSGSSSLSITGGSLTIGKDSTSDLVGLLVQGSTLSVSGESTQVDVSGDIYVNAGGSATIEGGSTTVSGSLFVGYDEKGVASSGSLTITGGTVKVSDGEGNGLVIVGEKDSSLTVSGGSLTTDMLGVGVGATAEVKDKGSLTVSDLMEIADSGKLTVSGGEVFVGNYILVYGDENSGSSSLTISGGKVTIGDETESEYKGLYVQGSTLSVSGDDDTEVDISGDMYVNAGGSATIEGGEVSVTGDLLVGYDEEGVATSGSLTVSGGSLSANSLTIGGVVDETTQTASSVTLTGGTTEIESAVTIGEGSTLTIGDANPTSEDVLLTAASATVSGTLEIVAGTAEIETVEVSGTLTVSGGSLEISDGLASTGSVSVGENANLSLDGTIDLSSAITNEGTITLGDSVSFVLNDALGTTTEDGTLYTFITGSCTIDGWDSLTYKDFTIDGEVVSSARQISFNTADGSIIYNEEAVAADLTWNGSADSNVWVSDDDTAKNWTNGDRSDSFYDGDNVTFDSDGYKEIEVSGEVTAGELTVKGNGYTFSFDEDATLAADSLTITEEGSLTVDGSLTVTDTTTVFGDLSIAGDATLSEVEVTGSMTVSGGETTADSVAVSEGGELDLTGGSTTVSTVTIGEDSTLTVGDADAEYNDEDVLLTAGSADVSGELEIAGGSAEIETVTVESTGTLTVDGGSLTITSEDATTITGSLSVSDGSLSASGLTLAEGSETTISGGETEIDDAVAVAGSLSISDDGSLTASSIDVSGSLTMSGGSLTADSADVSGTLTVSGTVAIDSLDLSGSLSLTGGETTIGDLTSTETGSITVSTGATLKLTGTVDISSAISNSGTVTLGDDVVFVLNDSLTDDGTTYTFISDGTIDDWSSLDYQHFVYSDGSELSHGHVELNLSTDGTVVITLVHDGLTWTGEGSNAWMNGSAHDWVDHYNESDVFYNGDKVTFADTYSDEEGTTHNVTVKDVSIGEEIIADTVKVTGSGYTFTFGGDDASLTANSLTLDGDGASLILAGSGSITLEEVDVDAIKPYADADETTRLTVNEGTTLTVQDDIDLTVDGKADVSGTLNIEGGTTTATSIEVAEETGELTMTGGTLNAGSISIGDDATASFAGGNLNVGEITASTLSFGDGLTVGIYGDGVTSLTIESAITLAGSVTFDAEEDETITLSGKLDGDGKLVKDGAGTLIVSGEENAYTGGTTVSSGTLEATSMSALGTGAVAIDSGATLELSASGKFTNATSGSGTLNIANGAEVSFGADIGVKNVSVASGATLSGGATLTSSGATLDLAGNLSLDLAVGETITFSSNGKMTIESTASLSLSNADSLGDGSSFTFVDGGTVSGDIKSFLKTDPTLLALSVSDAVVYDDSNGLSVNIMKSGQQSLPSLRLHEGIGSDFVSAVISSSDLVLDSGIQSTTEVSSNPIARAILNGKTSDAAKMLNTLAPDDYAAMIAMPTTSFHNDINAIDNHLAAVRRTEFDENNRWGYFAQVQGTFVDNDDARDTQTFDFNLYGILAGVDYRMSNTLIVGATLGYDRGKADIHHGGKIESDDIRLTAYAGAQINDLVYANIGAQLGVGYYDAKRKTALGHADGDTSGFNAGVFADVGMDLTLSENLGLSARPYVGISFVHSIVNEFDDDLFEVGSFNGESLRTRIGCGLFWDVALGEMPSSIGLDISYAHDFCGKEVDIDADYKATGRSFVVTAKTMTEDFFTLGPVFSIGISDGVSAFAGYALDVGTDSSIGQNVYIGVRASF